MKLKTFIIAFLVLFAISNKVFAEAPVSQKQQFIKLLDQLARQSILDKYQDIVKHPEKAKYKNELKYAKEEVNKAKKIIPELRKLIKIGNSVFDYPGLIAHGKIQYTVLKQISDVTFEKGYILYLGVFFGAEGIRETDFQIVFDENGIITEVNDVDWKL
ncbi:MAG: hypothetical protein KAI43_10480 [Candidatus Aureabacteria bacterium]|nr:hypothetical protein [Candidatus Auribacterota bacterium]